jgi:hypothetical protein
MYDDILSFMGFDNYHGGLSDFFFSHRDIVSSKSYEKRKE